MKYFSLFSLLVLRIIIHPAHADANNAPFTSSNPTTTQAFCLPADLLSFEGKINQQKVWLDWIVSENQTADQFEVEKSEDGVHFRTAALVFSSETSDKARYQFYEKASGKKMLYRIKMISKKGAPVYSSVIEINPNVG